MSLPLSIVAWQLSELKKSPTLTGNHTRSDAIFSASVRKNRWSVISIEVWSSGRQCDGRCTHIIPDEPLKCPTHVVLGTSGDGELDRGRLCLRNIQYLSVQNGIIKGPLNPHQWASPPQPPAWIARPNQRKRNYCSHKSSLHSVGGAAISLRSNATFLWVRVANCVIEELSEGKTK